MNFSRSIEADGVGMHTEVREPKNSRALIPMISSSKPELEMVKHFLALEDAKQETLSKAVNALLGASNDDSQYLPKYLKDCINPYGKVDIEKFKVALNKSKNFTLNR